MTKYGLISRYNNFDLLRLFAALQVVFGHCVIRLNLESKIWFQYIWPFLGVMVFFVISGFLITESYKRNGNEPKYYVNRFLRIFPALLILLIITSIATVFTGDASLQDLFSYDYSRAAFGFLTYFPDTNPEFAKNFGFGCLNGSLWTIPVEFTFYLLLPAFFGAFKGHEKAGAWLVFIVSAISSYFQLGGPCVFSWLYMFFIGVLFNLYWAQICCFIKGKFLFWLAIFLLFRLGLGWNTTYYTWNVPDIFMNVLLGFVTISAAYTLPQLSKILRNQDYSYGIYLYHGLIINIFIEIGMPNSLYSMFWVILVSIICGAISWNMLEKRVLKFKSNKRL